MASVSNSSKDTTMAINNTQRNPAILSTNLEFWMSQLPRKLRGLPIIRLAIPGSHNTMTYTIERNNEVGPDQHDLVQAISQYISIFAKPIVFNWSVNQEESVKIQLDGGLRYLDLRVSVKSTDNKIYFLHGLYGAEVTRPLEDIIDWLNKHPNELIIMDFQHFYNFNEINHRQLIDKLNCIFPKKTCPVQSSLDSVTLDWLNERNYQLLIVYRNDIGLQYNNLWPGQQWPTPWPETVNPTRLIDYLTEGLQSRSHSSGFVSQCLLNPDFSFIAKHPCGNLRRDLTPVCRKVVTPWIEKHSPGTGGMNIVIADDVAFNDFQFSRAVIQRNSTLL